MPVSSALDVVEAVEDIASRLSDVAVLIEDPDVTDEDALTMRAGLAGVRDDTRILLRELDTTQEEDLLVVEDGAVLLQLWRWRRTTRHDLVGLLGQTRTIQDLCADFVGGQKKKTVVTKQGDTLQKIAARELGDWRQWDRLLAANPNVGAGQLASGLTLVIPERR